MNILGLISQLIGIKTLRLTYSSHMIYLATHLCFLPNQEIVIPQPILENISQFMYDAHLHNKCEFVFKTQIQAMYQSNQDDSTIMHIIMHTETKKLLLFGHIINPVSFVSKINLHMIQENQTLGILPPFLHFGGYIYGIKFIKFNHVRLW